jgi:hypothetical protein
MPATTSTSETLKRDELLQEFDMQALDMPQEEQMRQLMATRNEWKLYPRTCDHTGENILSAYSADSPYTVYKNEVWWGDSWEALDYGKDFDFTRPFFEQFYELQLAVPREGTSVFQSENCEYNSHLRESKNCYMNSLVVRAEDMHYCYWMVDIETALDSCLHISGKSSLCYECIDFGNCFRGLALQECYNCTECAFSFQLRSCDHCLFCSNLSNTSYHIFNKPCSQEEFERAQSEWVSGSYESWHKAYQQFLDVRAKAIHRGSMIPHCENVVGDHIFDSKNCFNCFDGNDSEDCSNGASINDSKDIHTCYSAGWPRCEKLYNCAVSRGCTDMAFCRYMWFSSGMRYCDSCQSCKNCFGCIGLRHKEYCILNQQYTKEEYEVLLANIIDHMKSTEEWGAFWPYASLPFAYNESAAQDYFPLTKEEILERGYKWKEEIDEMPKVEKVIKANQLPAIQNIPDDILNWAIECEETGKPFRIIKQELEFYRRMNLPVPHVHPMERHKRRMGMRNAYKLWQRKCDHCQKEIQTSYQPSRPEVIYCEECYLQEVY